MTVFTLFLILTFGDGTREIHAVVDRPAAEPCHEAQSDFMAHHQPADFGAVNFATICIERQIDRNV